MEECTVGDSLEDLGVRSLEQFRVVNSRPNGE